MTARGTDKYATTFMASYIAYTKAWKGVFCFRGANVALIQGVKQSFIDLKSSFQKVQKIVQSFCLMVFALIF